MLDCLFTALFSSDYQVIDYYIGTLLVSFTVIFFVLDSMDFKHMISNLALVILLLQNKVILWPQSQKKYTVMMPAHGICPKK